ncbi:hypothetical protein GBAR_LOCUS7133 [Geodia barretti]|uniref:Uncharacterized protein n=1 Tax=Geodia barretti TaxID=519541 RepID=A0AA35RII4_GEOBA|nr:hypothetical protein GBAR_LOCUS7133 [Geodia barretti]
MAYILFISFVVLMPILFNNMLVQYILGLENFRLIRGHLTSEKCLENEKVTKMVSVVSNIQERIPALERSHREMQQSLEHIMKTLQELNGKID